MKRNQVIEGELAAHGAGEITHGKHGATLYEWMEFRNDDGKLVRLRNVMVPPELDSAFAPGYHGKFYLMHASLPMVWPHRGYWFRRPVDIAYRYEDGDDVRDARGDLASTFGSAKLGFIGLFVCVTIVSPVLLFWPPALIVAVVVWLFLLRAVLLFPGYLWVHANLRAEKAIPA